jgi:hypothetical protein
MFFCRVLQLLVTVNTVSRSLILFTLMLEAIHSSETSVLITDTRHDIPEDRRENLRSYIELTAWVLYLRCNVSPMR